MLEGWCLKERGWDGDGGGTHRKDVCDAFCAQRGGKADRVMHEKVLGPRPKIDHEVRDGAENEDVQRGSWQLRKHFGAEVDTHPVPDSPK